MTRTPPTNEEIFAVIELTSSSGDQFCDRLRDLFAGRDYFSMPRTPPTTLEEYQEECYRINVEKGWFDSERAFGDDVALLHTEVSEMYEAYRRWELEDATVLAMVNGDELPKPEGVGSEVADVLIRLFDTCQRAGINLRAELDRKIAFNRTRPYRHGGKKV